MAADERGQIAGPRFEERVHVQDIVGVDRRCVDRATLVEIAPGDRGRAARGAAEHEREARAAAGPAIGPHDDEIVAMGHEGDPVAGDANAADGAAHPVAQPAQSVPWIHAREV